MPDEKWDTLFGKLQRLNGGVLVGASVDYWPDLEDIPCGNDIIGGPVAGLCSRCGEPHDNWPDGSGGKLCQDCWDEDVWDIRSLPPCAFEPVLPDNETLSALVADANLTGDENE